MSHDIVPNERCRVSAVAGGSAGNSGAIRLDRADGFCESSAPPI